VILNFSLNSSLYIHILFMIQNLLMLYPVLLSFGNKIHIKNLPCRRRKNLAIFWSVSTWVLLHMVWCSATWLSIYIFLSLRLGCAVLFDAASMFYYSAISEIRAAFWSIYLFLAMSCSFVASYLSLKWSNLSYHWKILILRMCFKKGYSLNLLFTVFMVFFLFNLLFIYYTV
jgi:hypothetical protein